MLLWELYAIAGLIFIILEMIVPSMFFLNLAFAGFLTAITAVFIKDWVILTLIFVLLSILSILLLRPLLLKKKKSKELETGLEGKYIGHIAKVIEPICENSGAITIYDERWEARSNEEIPKGCGVRILRNESLVFYVEKL